MKRLLLIALLLILGGSGLRSADGQGQASLAGWAPVDSDAFLTLETQNQAAALDGLNVGAVIGAYLQPARPRFSEAQPFDTFFPLEMLDLETASFTQLVLPWLGDSLAVAYRSLDWAAGADPNETLLIMPARDPFSAAAALSSAVEGQDLLRPEVLPGGALYVGDRAAIALTPTVVLIGGEAMVRDALRAGTGQSPSLAGDLDFQAVVGALPASSGLFFYTSGASAASALPALLSLSGEAAPLLASYGAVLESHTGRELPASMLMQGEVAALGVALDRIAPLAGRITAEVVLLTPDSVSDEPGSFQPDLLNAVPRSAMLVYSTAEAGLLADAALAALPYALSGPAMLSALPLQPAVIAPPPEVEAAAFVVNSLLAALEASGVAWGDLRGQLGDSALVALLPRPNNPLPVTRSRADVLLVAESDDAAALADGVSQLLTALQLPVVPVTDDDGSVRYQVKADAADEPVLQFAALDGLFVLGTGRSLDEAARALAGDNRLIDQPRWEAVGAPAPGLYLDLDRLYNTFLPTQGGSLGGLVNQVSLTGGRTADGLYQLFATLIVNPR